MTDRFIRSCIAIVLSLCVGHVSCATADEEKIQLDSPTARASAEQSSGTRRVLMICGLPGDADHHKLFSETVSRFHDGLVRNAGFSAQNITVLFGSEPKESDGEAVKGALRSTSEELKKAVLELRRASAPEDTLWVIVLGHTHYDGRNSWLNLPGPDLHELEFATLFNGIAAQEQVFFLTTPTSGFWIKPLSAKGRVILAATEEGWETNETEFPHEMARVLASQSVTTEFDVDEDGANTLFDLYVTVSLNLAQSYLDRELLATEHPLLDDNGDRKGTEVQIDFLTVEQGGRPKRAKSSKTVVKTGGEGEVAKRIPLQFPITESEPPASAQ